MNSIGLVENWVESKRITNSTQLLLKLTYAIVATFWRQVRDRVLPKKAI